MFEYSYSFRRISRFPSHVFCICLPTQNHKDMRQLPRTINLFQCYQRVCKRVFFNLLRNQPLSQDDTKWTQFCSNNIFSCCWFRVSMGPSLSKFESFRQQQFNLRMSSSLLQGSADIPTPNKWTSWEHFLFFNFISTAHTCCMLSIKVKQWEDRLLKFWLELFHRMQSDLVWSLTSVFVTHLPALHRQIYQTHFPLLQIWHVPSSKWGGEGKIRINSENSPTLQPSNTPTLQNSNTALLPVSPSPRAVSAPPFLTFEPSLCLNSTSFEKLTKKSLCSGKTWICRKSAG